MFASVAASMRCASLRIKPSCICTKLSLRFHLERKTGGLSRIIERGTKGIETIVRFTILNSVPTLVEFLLTAVIFWKAYGFSYVLITAITVWAYVWFTVRASDWRIAIRRSMNASDTDANTKAIDSLLNFETVKYFGNEDMEAKRFDASMARYEKAATEVWTSLGWLNSDLGRDLWPRHHGHDGDVGARRAARRADDRRFRLRQRASDPALRALNFIGFVYREIRQGLTDIEQMFDTAGSRGRVVDKPDAKPLAIQQGSIAFKDVHFAYRPLERQILRVFPSRCRPARPSPFVGPSGAGKSTISRLLYRFYDVQQGSVTIDGQDVRDITQKSLRAAIGMVPQDTVLFNDSIAYNIRYGRLGATDDEELWRQRMWRRSAFHRNMPDGFGTMVGERGLKLSGGEKQRVAIARILKAPPI